MPLDSAGRPEQPDRSPSAVATRSYRLPGAHSGVFQPVGEIRQHRDDRIESESILPAHEQHRRPAPHGPGHEYRRPRTDGGLQHAVAHENRDLRRGGRGGEHEREDGDEDDRDGVVPRHDALQPVDRGDDQAQTEPDRRLQRDDPHVDERAQGRAHDAVSGPDRQVRARGPHVQDDERGQDRPVGVTHRRQESGRGGQEHRRRRPSRHQARAGAALGRGAQQVASAGQPHGHQVEVLRDVEVIAGEGLVVQGRHQSQVGPAQPLLQEPPLGAQRHGARGAAGAQDVPGVIDTDPGPRARDGALPDRGGPGSGPGGPAAAVGGLGRVAVGVDRPLGRLHALALGRVRVQGEQQQGRRRSQCPGQGGDRDEGRDRPALGAHVGAEGSCEDCVDRPGRPGLERVPGPHDR